MHTIQKRREPFPRSATIAGPGPGADLTLAIRVDGRARRVGLRAGPAGDVVLVLPDRHRLAAGLRFARENNRWIAARLAAGSVAVPFEAGAVIPLRGEPHRLVHDPASCGGVRPERDSVMPRLRVGGPATRLATTLRPWLWAGARADLTRAAERHAERLGRPFSRLSIRDTRSQWGSCSRTGALSFSWRLVMAPPVILDYVAAHEVAHLAVFGHGPAFRSILDGLHPDAAAAEAWLAGPGRTLFRYGLAPAAFTAG